MLGASNEIQHWDEYDYVVINHDIDCSVEAVRAILAAERLRRTRLTGLKQFVQEIADRALAAPLPQARWRCGKIRRPQALRRAL